MFDYWWYVMAIFLLSFAAVADPYLTFGHQLDEVDQLIVSVQARQKRPLGSKS